MQYHPAYTDVKGEVDPWWRRWLMPLSHPEVCREELEAEEKRRRLVEVEGALFVPLSLVDLCVRLVRRLATLESAFWEGIERHRLPTVLADTLKAARPLKAPLLYCYFFVFIY